ncbi:hypothetical protein [Oceanobacillus sp. CF4.6]
METNGIISSKLNEINGGGYRIIEVNLSDSSDNLYAVCTPVRK